MLTVRKQKEAGELLLDLFSSPCQISAFYVKEYYSMILVVKHDSKGVDREVSAHIVSAEKIADHVEKEVLLDQYWRKAGSLIELAGTCAQLISRSPTRLTKPPAIIAFGLVGVRNRSDTKDGFLQCVVDLEKNRPTDLLFGVTGAPPKKKFRVSSVNAVEKLQNLFSAFWYPPFIFEEEAVTLKPKFVVKTIYKGYQILFNNHSFIFAISPIKPPVEPFHNKAVEIFNEIIGTAQLLGIEGSAVGFDEVLWCEYTHKLDKQIGYTHPRRATVRSLISKDFFNKPENVYQFNDFCTFKKYKKSAMVEVVKKAEKITQDRDVRNYILSYLDAKTHFLIEQFKTSFFLTWIVLEKYVDDLWLKNLASQHVSRKRLDKLAKSMLWTVDDKLEALNLLGQVSNERYFEITRLKGIRNAIVHKGREVTKQEAEECLKFSFEVMREVVRDTCLIEL